MSLNPAQLEAVRYTAGPLLVLAGAGSGKTRVITQKIAALVAGGIAPYNIAAVTFTNKAAREMRQRVAALLDAETAKALKVSTFHTLGLNVLKREYGNLGYKRGFTIFDAHDSRNLVKELLKNDNADTEGAIDAACAAFSAWKSELVTPDAALAGAADELEQARARQYAAYQRALQAYNALDFDDLIVRPVFLFRELPRVLEAWQDRIQYMLGDEYQDTNIAQYQLMGQLVGARGAFTVVGDDDQSIYAWRGARPDNLRSLARRLPGAQGHQARAELSLLRAHPGGRQRPDRQQPAPVRQAPLERARSRRSYPGAGGARRRGRGRPRRDGDHAHADGARRRVA
jgi:ATP-dependent DNA helicase Rep